VPSAAPPRAPGTTVEVADLFFNTPARRKFLHSPAGELRAAIRMLECYALGYPEVGFRLMVDGKERFAWPAASRLPLLAEVETEPTMDARRERAAALWGPRHAEQLIEVHGERDGVRLEGLLGLPDHGRATREGQVFPGEPPLDPEPDARAGAAQGVRQPAGGGSLSGGNAVALRAARPARRERASH
jgi:DNA mismatch repair protein MutL